MVQIGVAVVACVVLFIMSLRVNRRLSHVRRLPMQWSITGSVNWTAPRRVALAFMPVLGGVLLAGTTFVTFTRAPRPGQEGMEVPVITILSLALVAAHALHLWLIEKTLKSGMP